MQRKPVNQSLSLSCLDFVSYKPGSHQGWVGPATSRDGTMLIRIELFIRISGTPRDFTLLENRTFRVPAYRVYVARTRPFWLGSLSPWRGSVTAWRTNPGQIRPPHISPMQGHSQLHAQRLSCGLDHIDYQNMKNMEKFSNTTWGPGWESVRVQLI